MPDRLLAPELPAVDGRADDEVGGNPVDDVMGSCDERLASISYSWANTK
jgi:hypothetical protein